MASAGICASFALAPPASFRLRAAETGPHALLAVERERSLARSLDDAPTSRPETRTLELGGGATQRADLLLGLGEHISGRVVDLLERPQVGAGVSAGRTKQLRGVELHGLHIGWTEGRFERAGSSTTTDELGRFELTGLGVAEYNLSANAGPAERELGADGNLIAGMGFSAGAAADGVEVRVAAPAADVELAISTFTARIEVVSGGEPVPEPEVAILWPGGIGTSGSRGNERGELRLHGQGPSFGLRVSKPGYLPRTFELPLDIPRDVDLWRIELEPGPAPATLALELAVEGAMFPERVSWGFELATEDEPEPMGTTGVGFVRMPFRGSEEWPADGQLELGPTDPGRYRLHLTPTPPHGETTFLLPVELELELRAGARERRAVRFALGGRLRIFAPELPGGRGRVSASFVDEAGELVAGAFMFQVPGGGQRTSSSLVEGLNELAAPLPPGAYLLVLDPRRPAPTRIPFEIEPGSVTDLRLGDTR